MMHSSKGYTFHSGQKPRINHAGALGARCIGPRISKRQKSRTIALEHNQATYIGIQGSFCICINERLTATAIKEIIKRHSTSFDLGSLILQNSRGAKRAEQLWFKLAQQHKEKVTHRSKHEQHIGDLKSGRIASLYKIIEQPESKSSSLSFRLWVIYLLNIRFLACWWAFAIDRSWRFIKHFSWLLFSNLPPRIPNIYLPILFWQDKRPSHPAKTHQWKYNNGTSQNTKRNKPEHHELEMRKTHQRYKMANLGTRGSG